MLNLFAKNCFLPSELIRLCDTGNTDRTNEIDILAFSKKESPKQQNSFLYYCIR